MYLGIKLLIKPNNMVSLNQKREFSDFLLIPGFVSSVTIGACPDALI